MSLNPIVKTCFMGSKVVVNFVSRLLVHVVFFLIAYTTGKAAEALRRAWLAFLRYLK